MFEFFFRTRQKPQRVTGRRTRLAVEALESRYCPTNSLSLSLLATPTTANMVQLTGNEVATGVNPTTTTITFSGVMVGTVTPDGHGNFSYTAPARALGEVDAVATDPAGDASNQAAAQIDNWAGWGLTMTTALATGTTVLVSGQVTAANPSQTLITLGGVMSGTITPNADGSFAYKAPASQLGTVSAVLRDSGGNTQAIAQATVQCPAPSISNLAVTIDSGTTVTLTGTVIAPSPGGLVVSFSGPVVATTTTNPDGTFSLTTAASQLGTISAKVTNVWNQISAATTVVLASPPPNITSFGGSNEVANVWVLDGQLSNSNAEGWTVSFTGVPGYSNLTTTVLDDGSFWESVSFPNQLNVTVRVTVTDCWGQQGYAVNVLS